MDVERERERERFRGVLIKEEKGKRTKIWSECHVTMYFMSAIGKVRPISTLVGLALIIQLFFNTKNNYAN